MLRSSHTKRLLVSIYFLVTIFAFVPVLLVWDAGLLAMTNEGGLRLLRSSHTKRLMGSNHLFRGTYAFAPVLLVWDSLAMTRAGLEWDWIPSFRDDGVVGRE